MKWSEKQLDIAKLLPSSYLPQLSNNFELNVETNTAMAKPWLKMMVNVLLD